MTNRDRLIELFEAVEKDPAITCPHYKTDKTCDTCKYTINNVMCNHTLRTVDYLLANGVIVPPCKIGNTVWWVDNKRVLDMVCVGFVKTHKKLLVTIARNTNDFTTRYNAIFNKEVFLTKEEAEEKLKELNNNGNSNKF